MTQVRVWLNEWLRSGGGGVAITALIGLNVLFTVVANASFKVSADSSNWRLFLVWQVIGNTAGFFTVLTLTALLKFIPLNVAFTVTTGLGVFCVQILAAALLFHEPITPAQWLGALLVAAGVALMMGH